MTYRSTWLIGGAVALVLALGVTGMALSQTGHGFFGMQASSTNSGYGGMMGNGGGTGGSSPQGTPVVGVTQVAMTNQDVFSPASIQVAVGTTVTWTNADADAHTVTFMPMMFNSGSGDVVAHATFHRTFTSAGTYYYRCIYHQGMVGEVIVTG